MSRPLARVAKRGYIRRALFAAVSACCCAATQGVASSFGSRQSIDLGITTKVAAVVRAWQPLPAARQEVAGSKHSTQVRW